MTEPSPGEFPVYEVPEFVREQFPAFDPADPATWPEPDRCTNGRPWGHDAYEFTTPGSRGWSHRWTSYLVQRDRAHRSACRNRWRDPDARLCGTHVKPWNEAITRERRRVARNARELEYRDLAKRLGAHGIEGDAGANGVLLRREAVEIILRLLDGRR